MILTGDEIVRLQKEGILHISPFDEKQVNPNSYDVTLMPVISWYDETILDVRRQPRIITETIPESGYLLKVGELYLCSTVEEVGSNVYVPLMEGKSSLGRMGLQIHQTAGYGDLGFKRQWTLEVVCHKHIWIYPGMRIGQVVFYKTQGNRGRLYSGKYKDQHGPTPSKSYEDYKKD